MNHRLLGRAVFAFVVLPGTVAILIPLSLAPRGNSFGWLGYIPLAIGSILLLWCVRDFYVAGKGTLAPWAPPENLVRVGLYRFSRNPMYVGVVLMLVGWAVGFHSGPLWAYAVIVMVAFHLRVVLGEEPWLARTFPAEWTHYKAEVPRWFLHSAWWRGTRGEWYVVVQVALILLVFVGPRTLRGLGAWPTPLRRVAIPAGVALALGGSALLLGGLFKLGSNLTPLPHPKPGSTLIQTGPYRLVRHPMYAGGIALAFGWALLVQGWLTLGYACVLLVFLDIKSAREERWLNDRFPDYRDYQRRVRKLIPFIH